MPRRLCFAMALALAACGSSTTESINADATAGSADARRFDAPPASGADAPTSSVDARRFDATPGVDAPVVGTPDAPIGGTPDATPPAPDAAPDPDAPPVVVPTTAYRVDTLLIRDPHTLPLGCTDVTDPPGFFGISVNGIVDDQLNLDDNGDGQLDLSVLLLMKPLDSSGDGSTDAEVVFGDCAAPASSKSCTASAQDSRFPAVVHNSGSGLCLGIIPATESSGDAYAPASYPPIGTTSAQASAACGVTEAQTLTFNIAGALITLEDAQVAARYADGRLVSGLIRGFISEADAEVTKIPTPIGMLTVSSLFWGGSDNACEVDAGDPTPGDLDVGPDLVSTGWYLYLNFTAEQVSFTEN